MSNKQYEERFRGVNCVKNEGYGQLTMSAIVTEKAEDGVTASIMTSASGLTGIDSAHARHTKILLRLRKPPLRAPRKPFISTEDDDSVTESLTGSWDPSTATSNVLCAAITGSVLSGE